MAEHLHHGHRSRLREISYQNDFKNLEEHQLLELMLTYVIPRRDTNPIAHNLIKEFGSFAAVLDAKREDLEKIDGIGPKASNFLVSIKHFFYAYNKGKIPTMQKIDTVEKSVAFFNTFMAGKPNEEFYMACLDNDCRVKHYQLINTGSVNKTEVSIRKILEICFKINAVNVMVCHNHPEGNSKPSFSDTKLTKALMTALAFNNITLVDHIIVSNVDFFSYRKSGDWKKYLEEVYKTVGFNYAMQKPISYEKD
jgi:DNA repair protein RadC